MLLNVRFGDICVKTGRIRAEMGTPKKTEFPTYPYNGGVMQLENINIIYKYSYRVDLDMGKVQKL